MGYPSHNFYFSTLSLKKLGDAQNIAQFLIIIEIPDGFFG